MKTPIELFGVECLKGWYPLIEPLFKYIEDYNDGRPKAEQIVVTQVKEKWGTLHFYVNHATDELFEMIRKAEILSKETCEKCGHPGQLRKIDGWWMTVCDDCLI